MASTASQNPDQQVDIGDHPVAWRWMVETARKDPEGFLRLTGPNMTRFRDLYGEPQWTSDGKRGWKQGWGAHLHGLEWIILAGEKQTIYRIRVPVDGENYLSDQRVGVGITSALGDILRQLNENPIA
jgi:hypothetical protein